jgi:hypothetical protein
LDEALATGRTTSEQFCEAEILRVRGGVLARMGQVDDALAGLDEAAGIAAHQGSPILEAKALIDRLALHDDHATRRRLNDCLAGIDHQGRSMVVSRAHKALGLTR